MNSIAIIGLIMMNCPQNSNIVLNVDDMTRVQFECLGQQFDIEHGGIVYDLPSRTTTITAVSRPDPIFSDSFE